MLRINILAQAKTKARTKARSDARLRALQVAGLMGAICFARAVPASAQTVPLAAPAPVAGSLTLTAPATANEPFVFTIVGPVKVTTTTTHTAESQSSITTIATESNKKPASAPIQITTTAPVTIASTEAATTTTTSTPTTTTVTTTITSATARVVVTVPSTSTTRVIIPPEPGATIMPPAPGVILTPEGASTIYQLARAYAKAGIIIKDYEAAEKNARTALTVAPNPADKATALTLLGGIYQSRGLYEQAAAQWSALAALKDPENEGDNAMVASLGLAQSLASQGKIEDAIAELNALRAKAEADPELDEEDKADLKAVFAFGKAAIYLKVKQYSEARLQFEGLLKAANEDAIYGTLALVGIAESDVLQGNFPQALVSYRRVLDFKAAKEKTKANAQKQIALLNSTLAPEMKEQELQANLLLNDKMFDIIARGVSVGFNDEKTDSADKTDGQ